MSSARAWLRAQRRSSPVSATSRTNA
jgi:hypothetical protein